VIDVLRFLDAASEERGSKRPDFVAVEIADGLAQECGRGSREGAQAVQTEAFEDSGLIDEIPNH